MADSASLGNTVRKDARIAAFWNEFCLAAGVPAETPYQAWHFGDSAALAHELAELVIRGPKRATAGLAAAFDVLPHAAPVPGGYSVITEFDGTPRAVIRTVRLDTRPFRDVDADFAWDEGEGDRTLADWQDGHHRYFDRECTRLGITFSEDLPMVLERFELLYPFEAALNPVGCGPRVVQGYIPAALADSMALQAHYYARAHGFGACFEAGRLRDAGEFLGRYDPTRDGVWLLVGDGRVQGTLVIDGGKPLGVGHLRWFIVDDAMRGRGFGRRMMQLAMEFCDARFDLVFLTTFAGLDAARGLYEAFGFVLVEQANGATWGRVVTEQRFERRRR